MFTVVFVEKYHKCFFEEEVTIMTYLMEFLQSEDENFVHIGLWILAQFSAGGEGVWPYI